jgi:hypothetical protein
MKNTRLTLLTMIALLGFSLAAFGAQTFSGEIMDSQCAMMGSHTQMEKMHPMIHGAKQCTLQCVKMGGHFVLYDHASKKTYKLDPESNARPYAGERVRISGTLDGDTIHVGKISKRSL